MAASTRKIILFWFLAVTACLLDQASKEWIFARLPGQLKPVPGHYLGAHRTLWQASDQVDTEGGQTVPPGFHLHIAYTVDEQGRQIPHVNQGALFGMGGAAWQGVANGLFALVSLLVAVALGLFVTLWPEKPTWMLVTALGLVAGGAVGNLFDRVRFSGVRDFLHWNYLFDWPVFNVADVFLVVGAGLILLVGIGAPEKETEKTNPVS
ncbi:MAG: signal peptidase II [Gemmataceae bacterium]